MEKKCKSCDVVKDIDKFYKNSKCLDGYLGECKECLNFKRKSFSYPVIEVDKTCTGCLTLKPYTEFGRNKAIKDGLHYECRGCSEKRAKVNIDKRKLKHIEIPLSKKCSECDLDKPASAFSRASATKDRLQHQCRECKRDFTRSRNNQVTTLSKPCKDCGIVKAAIEFRNNKASADGLRHECRDCMYEAGKEYRQDNKDQIYESKKKYSIDNRVMLNKKRMEWYHSDLPRHRAKSNFYVHLRRLSQPGWAIEFKSDWDKLYSERLELEKSTGNKYHIDHIIPVVHSDVCGLSVPWNYQILISSDNIKKNNKFDGTYENESWRG